MKVKLLTFLVAVLLVTNVIVILWPNPKVSQRFSKQDIYLTTIRTNFYKDGGISDTELLAYGNVLCDRIKIDYGGFVREAIVQTIKENEVDPERFVPVVTTAVDAFCPYLRDNVTHEDDGFEFHASDHLVSQAKKRHS